MANGSHKHVAGPVLSVAVPTPVALGTDDDVLPPDESIYDVYVLRAIGVLQSQSRVGTPRSTPRSKGTALPVESLLGEIRILITYAYKGNQRIIRVVASLFKHRALEVRQAAAQALPKVAKTPRGDAHAIEVVVVWLKHDDSGARQAAAQALGQICDRHSQAAISELCSTFQDKDMQVRRGAAQALGCIFIDNASCDTCEREPADPSVVHAVCTLLKDNDEFTRASAADTLGKVATIGDQNTIEAVLPLLTDHDQTVRRKAMYALTKIATKGDPRTLAAVTSRLRDQEYPVRKLAVESLPYFVHTGDASALETAFTCLRDSEGEVRMGAVKAVARIAEAGDQATIGRLLDHMATESDNPVKLQVLTGLQDIVQPGDKGASAAVCRQLHNREWFVRLEALKLLANIAYSQDKQTLKAVERLLQDSESDVRSAAQRTLSEIRQKNSIPNQSSASNFRFLGCFACRSRASTE